MPTPSMISTQSRPFPLTTRRRTTWICFRPFQLRNAVFGLAAVVLMFYLAFVETSFQSMQNNEDSNDYLRKQLQSGHQLLQELHNEPLRKFVNQIRPNNNHHHFLQCSFRLYPSKRYYGLQQDAQPSFLSDAEYIYGEAPILLKPPSETRSKLCVNQTEWLDEPDEHTTTLPFADGTNPSLLSLERLRDADYFKALFDLGGRYLATLCMTNSQCSWNDSPDDVKAFNLSTRTTPNTVRTLLLVLASDFRTIAQTTLFLERNAKWGSRTPKKQLPDGSFEMAVRAFDDARLFVHKGQLWVSYREGPGFGYDKQVLNPIHIAQRITNEEITIDAKVKASETTHFCCGRNMALMPRKNGELQSLTWVDPITVITVDGDEKESGGRRRLLQQRRKSHVHGTNAFMVEFGNQQQDNDELLGIAHFHRPPDRNKNDYARFGHHYTHAFFTIPSSPPYFLKRLSPEFALPSDAHPDDDADIIQFWSGLEVEYNRVIVAYGINDCEGAVITFPQGQIDDLLRPVADNKEVVDVMSKLHHHQ